MDYFITTGIFLGLTAGFAPGPLLTLVISETVLHGVKSGLKVALAPIITDLPIIILSVFLLSRLSCLRPLLGIFSFAGSCFLFYLGFESIRSKGVVAPAREQKPKSLAKGIAANTLSPHPYLFWLSVGTPMMTRAMNVSALAPLAFIGSFYLFLVGSKMFLALLAGKSRSLLEGNVYRYTLRLLGVALTVFAGALFLDSLKLMGLK